MSKLFKSHLRFWVRLFWTSVFVGIILLAVLVQIGRTLFPAVNDYRTAIETQLSMKLGVDISIGEIEALWQGLRPKVSLNEVSILSDLGQPVFEVGEIEVEISILKSLFYRSPSFRQLEFRRLEATMIQTPEHTWRVKGLPESTAFNQGPQEQEDQQQPSQDEPRRDLIIDDPLDIFLFGRRVRLSDTSLDFIFVNQLQATVVIPDIRLENDTQFHRLRASFALDGRDQELNLVVEGYGDPRDEEAFEAQGFLTLSDFPVEKMFAVFGVHRDALLGSGQQLDKQKWLDEGKLDLNLWFDRNAQGLSWQGDVSVEGVPFTPREGMIWPNTVVSDLYGRWSSERGWFLGVKGLDIRWEDFSAPPLNLTLQAQSFKPDLSHPLHITVQEFDVGSWYDSVSRAGLLSEPLRKVLDDMQPQGALKNIKLDVTDKQTGYFALKANVEQASIQAWQGVPAITNVNGYVESSAFGGHLAINSQQGFALNFPKVYQHDLQFTKALGDIRWELDLPDKRLGFSSGQIELSGDEVEAHGHLYLDIPFKSSKGNEPEMTLAIGVKRGVASLHKLLIPYTVPEKLNEWMDRSIKEGLLTDAGFIYHGSLMSKPNLGRSIQFGSGVQQAKLKFDPLWPALNDASGILLLDDSDFRVTNLEGQMQGIAISSGTVELVSFGEGANREQAVSLSAQVSGDSGRALDLLKQTPIAHILGEELSTWQVSGPAKGSVDVLVPLNAESQRGEQDIRLWVSDNRLTIPGLDLSFDEVSGPLFYSHAEGISSKNLRAKLWGQSLQADVQTSLEPGEHQVRIRASGRVAASRLRAWSGRPELGFARGIAPVQLAIEVPLQSNAPLLFRASSNLEGVSLDLPAPFNLSAKASSPLLAQIKVHSSKQEKALHQYQLQLADMVRIAFETSDGDFQGMSVALNDDYQPVPKGSIRVIGTLEHADVLQWVGAVDAYDRFVLEQPLSTAGLQKQNASEHQAPTSSAATEQQRHSTDDPIMGKKPLVQPEESFYPLNLKVNIEELLLSDIAFTDVTVVDTQSTDGHHFDIQSSDLVGRVDIFSEDDRVMNVDLDYLYLADDSEPGNGREVVTEPKGDAGTRQSSKAKSSRESTAQEPSGLAAITVADLPEMDFHVAKFQNGEVDFGEWRFRLRSMDGGVTAHNLTADVLGLRVQGKPGMDGAQLIWLQRDGSNESFFSGVVTARDVAPVMENWGMERMLTSEEARFDTDVQWLGAPDDVELERLFGIVDVELQRGRFVRGAEVGENPLVKLIGLLNFDTLARRFRLDFADLHPQGMSYDAVKGAFHFHRGMVRTPSPLLVDMTASDIQFLGDIDVLGETVDAQLVVTLPLAGLSTTAIAALTGGVPLAVGVFVVSKVFKRQVDQASSVRYKLSGSWDDPDVDLEKVFTADVEDSNVPVTQPPQ